MRLVLGLASVLWAPHGHGGPPGPAAANPAICLSVFSSDSIGTVGLYQTEAGVGVVRGYTSPDFAKTEGARFEVLEKALDRSDDSDQMHSEAAFFLPKWKRNGESIIDVEFIEGENLHNLLTSSKVGPRERERLLRKFEFAVGDLKRRMKAKSVNFRWDRKDYDPEYFKQNDLDDGSYIHEFRLYKGWWMPVLLNIFAEPYSELIIKTDNIIFDSKTDRLWIIDPY